MVVAVVALTVILGWPGGGTEDSEETVTSITHHTFMSGTYIDIQLTQCNAIWVVHMITGDVF